MYLTLALRRPVFLSTNEVPMKRPDAMAREMPIALYVGFVMLNEIERARLSEAKSRVVYSKVNEPVV